MQKRVANLSSSEEIAPIIPMLAAAKRAGTQADTDLRQIVERLNAKRRWVKPYKKGSLGSLPESHTYVLNTPTSKEAS